MRKPILMTQIVLATAVAAALAPAAVSAAPKGCPPGLAKKHNGCTPPGHAKGGHDRDDDRHSHYVRGDRITRDYIIIDHPDRYGLDPRRTYYRSGDYIYMVDRETREVLNLIGAVSAILN